MHILHMPSWYSTSDKPWRGMFVRDQALALHAAGVQNGIAFVERRGLSRFNGLNLAVSHWQTEAREEDDIPTIRMKTGMNIRRWRNAPTPKLSTAAGCRIAPAVVASLRFMLPHRRCRPRQQPVALR